MSLGLQFVKAVLDSGNPSPLRDVREEFFLRDELPAFRFVRTHLARHGVMPDPDTLRDNGMRLARPTEPASYYAAKMRERYIYLLIRDRNEPLVAAVKAKDMVAAMAIIRELSSLGAHVLEDDSFSTVAVEAVELLEKYNRVKGGEEPDTGILTGWPTLDRLTLGIQPGDLVTLAGRPSLGKSWVMLAMACSAWRARRSVGILSMEMSKEQIVRRLMALETGANPNSIRTGTLSTWAEDNLRGIVRGTRRRPPVWVNSANMRHKSTALVERLFSEHSPDIVFIDSAYRLTPSESRSNMSGWERQSQMVGELKQMAEQYSRGIVAVNQYNRSVKGSSNKAAELGTAANSDSWEQDSSLFIGIRLGPAPFEHSSRTLDLTKSREGPVGSFRINFGFSPVDFSEIAGEETYNTAEGWEE